MNDSPYFSRFVKHRERVGAHGKMRNTCNKLLLLRPTYAELRPPLIVLEIYIAETFFGDEVGWTECEVCITQNNPYTYCAYLSTSCFATCSTFIQDG